MTYSPQSGPDVTETKTTPFSFDAKKNTSYTITGIQATVNGNIYTGSTTVTGTTPNTNDYTETVTLTYSDNTAPSITSSVCCRTRQNPQTARPVMEESPSGEPVRRHSTLT